MRLKTAVLSTALASLLLASSTFAAATPAPQGPDARMGECHGGKEGKEGRMFHQMARMEHRLDRAVEKGRLTQAQADQFKAEARQLRDDARPSASPAADSSPTRSGISSGSAGRPCARR